MPIRKRDVSPEVWAAHRAKQKAKEKEQYERLGRAAMAEAAEDEALGRQALAEMISAWNAVTGLKGGDISAFANGQLKRYERARTEVFRHIYQLEDELRQMAEPDEPPADAELGRKQEGDTTPRR
jgi:hypothetical protein